MHHPTQKQQNSKILNLLNCAQSWYQVTTYSYIGHHLIWLTTLTMKLENEGTLQAPHEPPHQRITQSLKILKLLNCEEIW